MSKSTKIYYYSTQEMMEEFQKLREMVLKDVCLQKNLQAITNQEDFIKTLVELGREYDLQIESEDILTAMQENRRIWVERWI